MSLMGSNAYHSSFIFNQSLCADQAGRKGNETPF